MYTFENLCREDPSIALDDGAVKVILNTKGSVGEIGEDLKSLLRYMEGFAPDDDYTKMLDAAVKEVRSDDKWRREYMVLNEMLIENQRLGENRVKVAQVRKFRNRFKPDDLAELYILHPNVVKAILNTIDTHPSWSDEKIAESVEFV